MFKKLLELSLKIPKEIFKLVPKIARKRSFTVAFCFLEFALTLTICWFLTH